MKFRKLAEKVGFSLAVILQYEQLRQEPGFWDSLTFEQWLSLYPNDRLPAEAKEKALAAIKRMATTFSDLQMIMNYYAKETPLREWALEQMRQKASTHQDYVFLGRADGGRYDFDKMLQLASSLEELISFSCLIRDRSSQRIDSVLEKMRALENVGCQEWIHACRRAVHENVRKFILSKIGEFDLSTKEWLSLRRGVSTTAVEDLALEKALASAKSFEDCQHVAEVTYVLATVRRVLERACDFAQTFDQWHWIAQKRQNIPLAVEKMAECAQTFDQWVSVSYETAPADPLHELAFENMKRLASA